MSDIKVKNMSDSEVKEHLGFSNSAKVVRFERRNGKYIDGNGIRINTDYLMTKAHLITGNNGAFVLEA